MMELVNEIKIAMELEVRTAPDSDMFFEAVFQAKDLEKLLPLLQKHMGKPLKPPGKNVRLPMDTAKIVDLMSGLRREQSFYMKKEEGGKYACAALWPWQSDPSKITLKIRTGDLDRNEG